MNDPKIQLAVTGGEILNSLSSEELLNLAIVKIHMEGRDWRQVCNEFPRRCWSMYLAYQAKQEKS